MAEITSEWLEEQAKQVCKLFEDGFQMSDLFVIVPKVMEIVEMVKTLSSAEKKETAVSLVNLVIDKTDIPWIPDNLIDPLLKRFTPDLIELVIKASKGEIAINKQA